MANTEQSHTLILALNIPPFERRTKSRTTNTTCTIELFFLGTSKELYVISIWTQIICKSKSTTNGS